MARFPPPPPRFLPAPAPRRPRPAKAAAAAAFPHYKVVELLREMDVWAEFACPGPDTARVYLGPKRAWVHGSWALVEALLARRLDDILQANADSFPMRVFPPSALEAYIYSREGLREVAAAACTAHMLEDATSTHDAS